jgi:branched-chain amino acid aminotransferase
MFDQQDGVIWFNGEMVPWADAKVHVLTHSLHYGMGVFEGIRAYNTDKGTAVFRLQDHTDRLFRSALTVNMKIPFDKDTLNAAQVAAVRDNKLESAYIRPLCFYGSEGMGLRAEHLTVNVAIAAWEWGAYLGAESLEQGIRVRTSSFTRNHVNSTMCKAKITGNYVNSTLALHEALQCGVDEALLLDHTGYVAEGSGENVFIVRNGEIYTPSLTSALDGITRSTMFTLSEELGIKISERQLTRDDVYVADEAFFTGTAAEVTPIRELDGRPIGEGKRGPITEKLQSAYFDLVYGRLDGHDDWLTLVS